VLYLTNQGDILATAVPGFPVWDLGGLVGSTTWGLWIAAVGAVLVLRPVHQAGAGAAEGAPTGSAAVPAPRPPAGAGARS
jgi:hypothetical protein